MYTIPLQTAGIPHARLGRQLREQPPSQHLLLVLAGLVIALALVAVDFHLSSVQTRQLQAYRAELKQEPGLAERSHGLYAARGA